MDYDELCKKLVSAPEELIRDKQVKELNSVRLQPSFHLYETSKRSLLKNSPRSYLLAELAWYFNGDRTTNYISNYSKFWSTITENNVINSNYGFLTLYEKLPSGKTSMEWCVGALQEDIYSRQAIILYNKPEYIKKTKDFICTQTQQFLFRNNQLNSIVYIRSSDFIRGLSFDIPWWHLLNNILANTLGVKCGSTDIFIGSSHVYKEHYTLIASMANDNWKKYKISTKLTIHDVVKKQGMWNIPRVLNSIDIIQV